MNERHQVEVLWDGEWAPYVPGSLLVAARARIWSCGCGAQLRRERSHWSALALAAVVVALVLCAMAGCELPPRGGPGEECLTDGSCRGALVCRAPDFFAGIPVDQARCWPKAGAR